MRKRKLLKRREKRGKRPILLLEDSFSIKGRISFHNEISESTNGSFKLKTCGDSNWRFELFQSNDPQKILRRNLRKS